VEIGVDSYLVKPVTYGELTTMLRDCVVELRREIDAETRRDSLSHTGDRYLSNLLSRWLVDRDPVAQTELVGNPSTASLVSPSEHVGMCVLQLSVLEPSARVEELASVLRDGLPGVLIGRVEPHRLALLGPDAERFTRSAVHALRDIAGDVVTVRSDIRGVSPDELPERYRELGSAISVALLVGLSGDPTLAAVKRQEGYEPLRVFCDSLTDLAREHGRHGPERMREDRLGRALDAAAAVPGRHRREATRWARAELLRFASGPTRTRLLAAGFMTPPIADVRLVDTVEDALREYLPTCATPSQNDPGPLVRAAMRYVTSHIETPFTLRALADELLVSPSHLSRVFRDETGEHYVDYVTRCRMDRACELLGDPSLRVYEIAHRLGYSNLSHFHNRFKEHTGVSPGEFRRRS
jgi:AraC-like DNA-binding protein